MAKKRRAIVASLFGMSAWQCAHSYVHIRAFCKRIQTLVFACLDSACRLVFHRVPKNGFQTGQVAMIKGTVQYGFNKSTKYPNKDFFVETASQQSFNCYTIVEGFVESKTLMSYRVFS